MRGHVRKRGTKWCFVLDVGRDENGKRVRKWFSGYVRQKDAEKAMAAKITEIENGGYVIAPKETVETYLRRWLEDKTPQIRYGTYRKYAWLVDKHIIPRIGKHDLSKLKPAHLQKLYADLRNEAELAPRTVLHVHRIVHEALDRAMKWGLIARNSADAVETPRADSYHAIVWTAAQCNQFLTATRDERLWGAYALALLTGMRQGELLGLRWSDVDAENRVLRIERTQNWVKGKPTFRDLKTDRSRRAVALSSDAMDVLRKQKSHQNEDKLRLGPKYQDNDMVISNEYGVPLSQNTLAHAFRRAMQLAEVPTIRFHDLRHTHASLLLQQGVHPKVVSERLGHSSISITMDTYSHVLPGLQQEAADRFDMLLKVAKK